VVRVARQNGSSGLLVKGDALQIGDKVSTGADGIAEILLNPGSYVRLGGNSTFSFKTTSLEELQIELTSGSAILEVFAAKEFQVFVSTPKAKYVLIETGVYRVDVSDDQNARLRVWKGRARVNDSEDSVKGGRSATMGASGAVAISRFDRDEKDALDNWSKTRGKDLAEATARLQRANLRTSLMRSFLGRRWNVYNSFGLWISDPFYGSCFLPFGYGWNSPYGFSYRSWLGWYHLPPIIYYPPSTGSGTPTGVPINTMDDPPPTAPFQRMQRTMGGSIRDRGINRSGTSDDTGTRSSSPTYFPAPSSAPAPPPTSSDSGGGGKTISPRGGGVRQP
jgi:hypothetical protein